MTLPDHIFKDSGDILGKIVSEINTESTVRIFHAFFNLVHGNQFLIAHDMTSESAEIVNAAIYVASLYQKKIQTLELDTFEILQFATKSFNFAGGIYISAFGQESGMQGIRFVYPKNSSIHLNEIKKIAIRDSITVPSSIPKLKVESVNYDEEYRQYIFSQVDISNLKKFKIALDAGNGMGGLYFKKLFKQIKNIQIDLINGEPNGYFPHHKPDLSKPYYKNFQSVIIKNDADFGLITDIEGSQMILLDEKGELIPSPVILAALRDYDQGEYAGDYLVIQELLKFLILVSERNVHISDIIEEYKQPEIVKKPEVLFSNTSRHEFEFLLNNLWYTWNSHFIMPIIDLYGDGWRKNSAPKEFIAQYGSKRLDQIFRDNSYEIHENYRLFKQYLSGRTWFDNYSEDTIFNKLKKNPIAYFSLEYGLVDWLQIYSGGLGVLAGDYLKQASDMGVPVLGIGMFYHEGFFHQDFGEYGEQIERYIHQDPDEYPFSAVVDKEGNQLDIVVEVAGHSVYVRAWKMNIGKVPLYLLDTDYSKNKLWDDRMITAHLYGGNEDTRIRQEIVLGIGGARLLKALEIDPAIFHMNEGHSGFLVLEEAKRYIDEGYNFTESFQKATDKLIFTNHTLKHAGNDIFPYPLVEKHLSSYQDDLKTNIQSIYDLGKDDQYSEGKFSMTMLGLRNAKISNAVSILHRHAAKKLWPEFNLTPITNGVHMATWISPEIHELLDKYVGEYWHYPEMKVDFSRILNIPATELWEAHKQRKEKLITSLNNELGLNLDPDALTIAWSRRLASYKRPDMITQDIERLKLIVGYPNRPVQILIAGKAHPKDKIGKEILQRMNAALSIPDFKNKAVIIPGYNWQLARRMTSGADIWLNTPYRFEEASGTSGMKAAANGVLQLTTKDGWTDEVDWFKKGWVIDETEPVKSLYDTLEYQIMPLFFDAISGSFNKYWIDMMKNSMQLVLENYSTERMMKDYLEKIYKKILF